MDEIIYPKTSEEWRAAIQNSLGITQNEGKSLYQSGKIPIDEIKNWLKKEYLESCGQGFIDALYRNIEGFIFWVYGDGPEPCWPGSD